MVKTPKKRILAVGECMAEMRQTAKELYQQKFAGDTFNTLYYLAKTSSFESYYYTVIGNCKLSKQLMEFFKTIPIHLDYVYQDLKLNLGLYLIVNDQQGERSFVYYRQQSAAKQLIQYFSYAMQEDFFTFDAIYLSGISLAILSNNDRKILINELEKYARQGGQIIFDNNYRHQLWSSPHDAHEAYKELHTISSIVFVTFEDEQLCYGDKSIEDTLNRYYKFSPLVVIKNGSKPVFISYDKTINQYPVSKINHIIDTTGAGDAFNSGFINKYLYGESIKNAVEAGCQLAGKVIQQAGAIIPIAEEKAKS